MLFRVCLRQSTPRVFARNTSCLLLCAALLILMTAGSSLAQFRESDIGPQQRIPERIPERVPGEWTQFRKARYADEPLLLHLRNGHERAVLMPEPIRLLDETQSLPGCAVEIDTDVVGFFPTHSFDREPIRFVGERSGTVYELRVRASPNGVLETLQIAR